jgi:MFS family permease
MAAGGTFDALGARDFRLYWIAQVVCVSGQRMRWVAEYWLLYELTGSAMLLGAMALAQAVPATLLTLFGGAVADKVDQRRLLIGLHAVEGATLLGLGALALGMAVEPWHILALAFLHSAMGAFETPGRHAIFVHLVPRHWITSAVALNSLVFPGTAVIGPVISGYVLAGVLELSGSAMVAGGVVFTLAALTHAVYVALLVKVRLPPVERARGKPILHDMADGLRFIVRERAFALLIGNTYFMMLCVLSVSVLYPIFAKDILGVGPSGLGLLHTGHGVGSLIGAFWASSLVDRMGRGRAIVAGSLVTAVMLFGFALSTWYPLSLALIAAASVGQSLASVAVQSGLQLMVPDEYRGRVMGYWGMTHTSIRPLGEMQLAGVAALVSAPFALALGSVLVVAFVLLVVWPSPSIRRLNAAVQA